MKPYQWRRLALGSVLAAIVVTGIALLVVDGDASAGEDLFLEGIDDVGPDPFTTVALVGNTTTTTSTTAPSVSGSTNPGATSTTTTTRPGSVGASTRASARPQKVCDAAALGRDLEGAPGKARAWAEPLDLDVEDLPDHLRDLVPAVLAEDARVTNHGYRDGEAVARQSLLQAGTAVLVDEDGEAHVRCASGSPLLPPDDIEDPDYEGVCWDGCREQPWCSGARCAVTTTSSPSTSSTSSSTTSTTEPDDEDGDATTTTRRRTTTTRPATTTTRAATTTTTAAVTTTSDPTTTTTTLPDATSTSAP